MNNLNLLIKTINKIGVNKNTLSKKIKNIVGQYNGKDWGKYIVNTDDNYYKNLIYNNDDYEMFVVSWMPNKIQRYTIILKMVVFLNFKRL